MKKLTRRALIAGGGVAALGLGTLAEYASFRGKFDHMRSPSPSGKERYFASIEKIGAASLVTGVVHVGHSTHLIAYRGARLLTDPWFYDPAFGALSHAPGPAVMPEHIGPLDAILITHDHADHADLRAIDRLDKSATVLVATADLGSRIRALGFQEVEHLAPGESWSVGKKHRALVTAVPGLHDIYEIGFVVGVLPLETVYFAGDSRLHPALPAIAEQFRPRISILSVDGTRLNGEPLHVMTPEDAVTAARTLGSGVVMPSHAEAVFSDPIASHFFATTIADAPAKFRDLVLRDLPGVRCAVPAPGELVVL